MLNKNSKNQLILVLFSLLLHKLFFICCFEVKKSVVAASQMGPNQNTAQITQS